MFYLTYCSFYSSGNLLPHFYTASLMRKWAWFEGNVGVVKKIVRALCAGPSNLIRVPTPMHTILL